jgi:pimeloyl-ACP methyl ester carboxylesterase
VRGTILFLHGIFSDKSEFGRFDRQAAMLAECGFRSLRFDYRGHGEHELPSIRASAAGMVTDVLSALEYLADRFPGPVTCIAASFGGSLVLLALQTGLRVELERLVLLNPVVDYDSTFVHPQGEIFREAFSAEKWSRLEELGYIEPIPGVRLSRSFACELKLLRPYAAFADLAMPALIVHGTADRRVPHDVTRELASRSDRVEFVSIEGADHAFIPEPEERRVFGLVRDWLLR